MSDSEHVHHDFHGDINYVKIPTFFQDLDYFSKRVEKQVMLVFGQISQEIVEFVDNFKKLRFKLILFFFQLIFYDLINIQEYLFQIFDFY